MELGGDPGWACHHCILGISQGELCQAAGLCCFKSSPGTALLMVPGNLVEKQIPRPTPHARSTSMVTCAIPYYSPTRWSSPMMASPHFHGGSEQEALGIL